MNAITKPTRACDDKSLHSMKFNTVVKGIYSISCQCNNVEVEVFFSKQKTPTKEMKDVYFNRVRDKSDKWFSLFNKLCQQFGNVSYVYGVFFSLLFEVLQNLQFSILFFLTEFSIRSTCLRM